MAINGRSSIAKKQQIELAAIETKRVEQLQKLGVKFAVADSAKSSLGYIGIISLSMLFGSFLMNDFIKVCNWAYQYYSKRNKTFKLCKMSVKK